MIDNRFYTVEAQTIAESWWQHWHHAMTLDNEGLDALATEIEKALEKAHKRGFDQGHSQRESEAAANESESNDG